MDSRTPSAQAFFDDERTILEEFYAIKREYNSLDKTNPDNAERRGKLRARYEELDKQYGELFQKRVEKLSALLVAQESRPSSGSSVDGLDFGSDWSSDNGNPAPFEAKSDAASTGVDDAIEEAADAAVEEVNSILDVDFPDLEGETKEDVDHAANGSVETASSETSKETPPAEYGPIPENMMLVPIERGLVPTGGSDDTLPISSGILELAHTVSCPYCAEQIKPDARKCRHCNEWLKRSDDKKRFNFDAVKHPQLRDVQVNPSMSGVWKVTGSAMTLLGVGTASALYYGLGIAQWGAIVPEALLTYMTTGMNGVAFGGAVALLGVSCFGIGKLLAVPKRSPLPVFELARLGCIEELILAFSAGKELDETDAQGCSSLHAAVLGRQHATASYLLSVGADVEARTRKGETPLQLAVMNEDLDMVDYIIGHGANIHATNLRGSTLLHVAAWLGNNGLVRRFRDLGLDIDAPGKSGYTPLHFAAQGGHKETVRYLLVMGAKPDEASAKGHTPMYAAAKNGRLEICRMLLEAGASVGGEDDKDAPTPLRIARSNKQDDVVAFLEENGAGA